MKDTQQPKSFDMSAVMRALRKASQQARETAIQTNTAIVVVEDGKLVHIPAKQLVAEAKAKAASSPNASGTSP